MGNRVRQYRRAADMTQAQLAAAAGITQPFLVDIEKGRRGARPDTWQRIATALGTTVQRLQEEDNDLSDHPAGS